MSEYAPRCPFCANVIKVEATFWTRIGLKPGKTQCPTCLRTCDGQDAHTMGSAYWHWAESFRKELLVALDVLPVLPEADMYRSLGSPLKDDTRMIPSPEELVRNCLRHYRTVLVEMARGREARLEVVHLGGAVKDQEIVAVLGTTAPESGGKEQELLIARTGLDHFVLYTYPGERGAEPRLKRALHGRSPRALTEAHVAAMHAEPHAYHRH